jgi:hypothetical protein
LANSKFFPWPLTKTSAWAVANGAVTKDSISAKYFSIWVSSIDDVIVSFAFDPAFSPGPLFTEQNVLGELFPREQAIHWGITDTRDVGGADAGEGMLACDQELAPTGITVEIKNRDHRHDDCKSLMASLRLATYWRYTSAMFGCSRGMPTQRAMWPENEFTRQLPDAACGAGRAVFPPSDAQFI